MDGAAAVVLLFLFVMFSVGCYYARELWWKYKAMYDYMHKDDYMKVTREDLIPVRFRQYDFRLGNFLFTVTQATPKTLDSEMVDGLGIVKIGKYE